MPDRYSPFDPRSSAFLLSAFCFSTSTLGQPAQAVINQSGWMIPPPDTDYMDLHGARDCHLPNAGPLPPCLQQVTPVLTSDL